MPSNDNVVPFPSRQAKTSVADVLDVAREHDLGDLIVIGRLANGELYVASSYDTNAATVREILEAAVAVSDIAV